MNTRRYLRLHWFKCTKKRSEGFTLVEVILSLGIISVALAGLLLTYVNMYVLADVIRDNSLAANAVFAKLEEIKNMNFDNLASAAGPFDITDYGFTANQSSKGLVEVTPSFSGYPATLTKIRIVASYSTRLNRTIGEDKNFNGILDGSENADGNSRLDSSVEAVTLIAK